MLPRFNVNPSNRKIYGKTDSSTLAPSPKLSSKPLIKTIQFRYNSPLHFFSDDLVCKTSSETEIPKP